MIGMKGRSIFSLIVCKCAITLISELVSTVDERTLSLSDLLLTKMQIVEVNEKDLLDVVAIFIDYDVVDNEQGINFQYISKLTSNDWGLQKTLDLKSCKS